MTASNVLLTIVLICLLCHSLKTCLNIVELLISFQGKDIKTFMEASITMNMLTVISNLLIIMSSSSNFFVYLCKDHKFLVILNRCVSLESSFRDSTPVMRQDKVVKKYVTYYICVKQI